ncbi:MAG: DNA translocase FtsK, partial [Chitinophagaceae bacterium]
FPVGGLCGHFIALSIQNAIGGLGSVLIYIFIALLIAMFKFNISLNLQLPNFLKKKIKKQNADQNIETSSSKEKDNVFLKEENFKNPFRDTNAPVALSNNELSKIELIEIELNEELSEEDFLPILPVTPETPTALVINPIAEDTEENIPPNNLPTEEKDTLEPFPSSIEMTEKHATEEETTLEEKSEQDNDAEESDPYLYLKNYKYPSIQLLQDYGDDKIVLDTAELESNKNQIIDTLKNYSIAIQRISATVGPTVTLYEIIPAAGVRISKIKNLENDIALSLAALGIRIIAPIPGKGTIGIEVPNTQKRIVSMKTLLKSEKFKNNNYALPLALGKKIDNENFIVDLASMPHLLMAGATGQGKSVGINALLISLLFKKHPSQLKFVLVDPKKVELTLYRTIENHFLAKLPGEAEAIITDTKKVIHTLNSLCIEMDMRYDLLKDAACRNIREYNEKYAERKLDKSKGHQFLPFIVLVIDEFADLIMTAGKEVETPIARLAQLARAVGIHLIIATQRPSVNIITGTIKANFPARVAFRVSSKIDSRTILDAGGADQLIGKGDLLISFNGDLVRLQCAFVDTPEVEKVCEFIAQQKAYPQPFLLPEFTGDEEALEKTNADIQDKDPLFEEAAKLIVQAQVGSTSFLQRRMKLGFNRAGRIMDQLEASGIVGAATGSKPREVFIKTLADLDCIL